jgi:hypothetical protein
MASGAMFSFLPLFNHLPVFSFSKNVVLTGLSCLLFSRFCDRALLLVVCEPCVCFLVSRSAALSFSVAVSGAREY